MPDSDATLAEGGAPDISAQVYIHYRVKIHYIHSMVYFQHPQTVRPLASNVSHTPSANLANAHPASLNLEERLHHAQAMIHQELEDLETLRTDMNECNDILLRHVLVLRSVRNFLHS